MAKIRIISALGRAVVFDMKYVVAITRNITDSDGVVVHFRGTDDTLQITQRGTADRVLNEFIGVDKSNTHDGEWKWIKGD